MHGFLLLGFLAALLTFPAHAGRLANVEIHDRNTGQILPVYSHEGRYYVSGEPKHEYEIRIRNASGGRLLAVTSVDGVNVVSGDTASPDQGGYVLDRHGRVQIAGWRKSLDRIATFYFTKLEDSYAGRTDRPTNVGVIGVALFEEKKPFRWPWSKTDNDASANAPAPSGMRDSAAEAEGLAQRKSESRAKRSPKLGTGHGRSEHSQVVYTEFARASDKPDEIISIYYDSRRNLIAQGVIPVYSHNWQKPDPFPNRFVPDP